METNDYSDLVRDKALEQEDGANKYAETLRDVTDMRATSVQSSVYMAQPANPDRQAQVMRLANRSGLAPDLVERNFDRINQEVNTSENDYQKLIRTNPKLSSWMSNLDNAKLAKDDIGGMKNLEDKINDTSFGGDIMGALAYGSLNVISGLTKSVALFADSNNRGSAFGSDNFDPTDPLKSVTIDVDAFERKTGTKIDSGLYDNTFTRYLDNTAKSFQPQEIGADIIEEALNGNMSKAVRAATLQVVSNLPQLGLIAATRGRGLAVLGASSAGSKYAENLQAGIEEQTAQTNAYITGALETGIEMVGGIGSSNFKSSIKNLVSGLGPDTALNVVKESVKNIFKQAGEEGLEEFVTSVSQDVVDYAMDVSKDGLDGIWQRAANAFIVGAGSGGVVTSAVTSVQGSMEAYRGRVKTFNDVDVYNQVGDAAKATKLNERMPEKQKEFLEQAVEGTPIQEMYFDLEGFETYFQKKGMSPAQGATELGLQEQYNQAREAGSDIKVNYADWVGNAVNTEHYSGLQNDIKFDPLGSTKNQLATEETAARAELQAANDETLGVNETTEETQKQTPVSKLEIELFETEEALAAELGSQQRAQQYLNLQEKALAREGANAEAIGGNMTRVQNLMNTLPDVPTESEIKNRRSKALTATRDQIQAQLITAGVDSREARIQALVLGEGIGALADAAGLTPQQINEQFPLQIREGVTPAADGLNQDGVKYKITETEDGLSLESDVAKGNIEIRDMDTVEMLDPEMVEHLSGFERPAYVSHVEAKKGYGSKALKAMETAARRRGSDVVYLNASPLEGGRGLSRGEASKKLTEFYKSNGYQVAVDQGGNAMMFKPLTETLDQQGDDVQGQIQFRPRNETFDSIISLFKSKNQSTFAHESSHYLFNVMKNLAAREESSQRLKDDFKGLMDFVGVESADQIQDSHQEKIARAWEAYLMEGKAPTKKLTRAFANFKTWLTAIYKSVQGIENAAGQQIAMTDEVRSIFDRMLMSQEQIDLANMRMNYNPLFSMAGISTTATEGQKSLAQKYIDAMTDARIEADNTLREQLMETERRKQTKFYKEERAAVEARVTDELNNTQVYQAHSIITKGVMADGSPLEVGTEQVKIDKKSFIESYGEDAAKSFPRGMFDTNQQGVPVEVVSEMYGFDSTADFVDQFVNFIPKNENIQAQVNAEMDSKYPDMMADPLLTEKAVRAAHNENRDKVYRMEMDYLYDNAPAVYKDAVRRLVRSTPSDKVLKAQALDIIADQKVNEIRPSLYERAEAKHNKIAGDLFVKGDILGALEAKRKAALNNYLYDAATEAQTNVEKDVQNFRKLFKKDADLAKTRDVDMVNAARAVLAQYGITRSEKTADQYLEPIAKIDPDTYQNLKVLVDSATIDAVPYKQATYGQFSEMSNAVKALWDLSKSSREIELGEMKLNLETSKNSLIATIGDMKKTKGKFKYEGSLTGMEKFAGWLAGWKAATRVVEHWTIEMGGEFKKIIYDPIQEAATAYRVEKNQKLKEYLATFKMLDSDSLNGGEIKAPELGNVTFKNKSEILGAILHTGNESNLRKLLVGRGYGRIMDDGSLDSGNWDSFKNRMIKEGVLTKTDFDWAQAVWDLNETMKPGAWKAHKKMYGFYPNEVTANEFEVQMADGTVLNYRGGYTPAIADPTRSEAAQTRQERDSLEMNAQNSFMFPTTGRGFTKSRAENYAVPLSIDINQVAGHIDKVLRFTHIEPNVKFVNRIVSDDGFREALATVDTAAGRSMLVPWLQRSASQRMSTPMGTDQAWTGLDKVVSTIRARTGMQIMGGNIINALQNYTGLSVAMVLVKPKHMRDALWDYTRNSTVVTETIAEKSAFMNVLLKSNTNEIMTQIDHVVTTPTTSQKIGEWVNKNAYILQKISQDQVSAITWQAAYDQSIQNGMNDIQAIKEADSIVRQTQANMTPEGSSRIMAGPPVLQLFVQFFGYFNNLANLNETQFKKIVRELGLRNGAGKLLVLFTLGTWMPAVMSDVLRRAASGVGFDEDDDDEYMDDFISMFLGAPSSFLSAQVPFVGQAANLVMNRFNDKRYDDRLNLSPAISTVEAMTQLPGDVYDAINKKSSERRGIRNVMNVLGVMTGLPGGFAARPLTYLNDIRNGDAEPTGPVDFVRGALTGKAGNN